MWREQLAYVERRTREPQTTPVPGTQATTLTSRDVTQKARLLSKPEPQYTDAARRAGVQGTVVLRGIFSSDGIVRNLYVLQALPFGLTTNVINAARKIRFTPATKDGHDVSMYIQLEYNFNLF